MSRTITFYLFLLFAFLAKEIRIASAQPYTSIELDKSERYQNRRLASEKTGDKKFNTAKRLYNNTVTHYNYFFNANVKYEEAIAMAKLAHKEDYTKLLPFYSYSLDETAKGDIDSIVYKCTAGILLHDLRSDWVDQLYLLLGKAYLLRKDFDSAAQVFNYINYAFAPKDDGYDIPIGSNESRTNGIFSISSTEKRNIWRKISSPKPIRNESFLWQIRNYIEQNKLTEAEALLEIIRSDRLFPARLKTDWYEMEAYLQYNRQAYDSAAHYIIRSLENAESKSEKARWEFLAAQLLERAGKNSTAIEQYLQAIKHTTDPYLEIYARLQVVNLSAGNKSNALQENLYQLLLMAKRDRFEGYRDIIYHAAAALELKRNNYTGAEALLLKSIEAIDENDDTKKQQAFLELADVKYKAKKYIDAASYYDSINVATLPEADQQIVNFRKPPFDSIAANLKLIQKEDSLQRIARLPYDQQSLFLKNLLRKIRKEKGAKENENIAGLLPNASNAQPAFSTTGGNDFYFNSNSLKSKGKSEFKAKWGNRPNIDNWRRQSAIERSFNLTQQITGTATADNADAKNDTAVTIASLTAELPLTTELMKLSEDKIIQALTGNGYIFQYQLQNYPAATDSYEEILKRFPDFSPDETLLFNLNSCYNKTGAYRKADSIIKRMTAQYPEGSFTKKLTAVPAKNQINPARQTYETIYQAFAAGRFEQAIGLKKQADEQFGEYFWTPQLLYIEAIYYIKQKEDSIALNRLNKIISTFSGSALAEKAENMINTLKKRTEIETYLSELEIEKPEELTTRNVELNNTNIISAVKKLDKTDTLKADISKNSIPSKSVLSIAQPLIQQQQKEDEYAVDVTDTQYVSLVLFNIDPLFISEGKNAFTRFNQEKFYDQKITVGITAVNDTTKLLLIGPFSNAASAISYIDIAKPVTNSRIVPWFKSAKYYYSMISPANLIILKNKKDPAVYQELLHQLIADKF